MGFYLTEETVETTRPAALSRRLAWERQTAYTRLPSRGDKNQYAFCANNPVNFTDPSGLDADVVVGADGKVSVNLPIKFEGKGATKDVIEKFTKGIEQTWSGKQGQYDVTVKVTAPVPGGKVNTITVPEGNGRAFVQGGNTGNWPAQRPAWTAAHEAGHLMGLDDRYNNAGPVKGWKGNIMGEQGGKIEPRNIADVIKANPGGQGKEPYGNICE